MKKAKDIQGAFYNSPSHNRFNTDSKTAAHTGGRALCSSGLKHRSSSAETVKESELLFKKYLFIITGLLFSGAGMAAAFIPVLPTFPFALAALWFFTKSSVRLKNWILKNSFLSPSIRRFKNKEGLNVSEKVIILLLAWISVGLTALFLTDPLWLKLCLLLLLLIKTFVFIKMKTYEKRK